MKFISIRGSKVTLDLSKEERDIMFRSGLQLLLDKWFGKKVVVLPVSAIKLDKEAKTFEITDELEKACLEEALNQSLRDYIGQLEAGEIVRLANKREIISQEILDGLRISKFSDKTKKAKKSKKA